MARSVGVREPGWLVMSYPVCLAEPGTSPHQRIASWSGPGATSLSRVRGTATPYAVPIVTALFKVPAGALTAVLGLLFIRGGFVPGIQLTSTAQVVAWALLFGAAQQTFTGLIDRQAQNVLNNVKSTELPATSRQPSG